MSLSSCGYKGVIISPTEVKKQSEEQTAQYRYYKTKTEQELKKLSYLDISVQDKSTITPKDN